MLLPLINNWWLPSLNVWSLQGCQYLCQKVLLNITGLKFSHSSRKNKQNKAKQFFKQKQSHTIHTCTHVLFASPSIHLYIHSCSQHHLMSCLLFTCHFKLGSWDGLKINQCPKNVTFSKIFKTLLIPRKF